jgi:hypothetical protein
MPAGRPSRTNRGPNRPGPGTQIRPDVIDVLMEMYLEWREECVGLRTAYERWLSVPVEERDLAFAVYRAALDREEQASAVYADRFDRVARDRVAPPRRWLRLRPST